MIVALFVLGVALIVAVAAAVGLVLALTRAHGAQEAAWAAERRELINRVQAPQIIPTAPVIWPEPSDPALDAIDEVGQVRQLDDEQLDIYLEELA